jgi:hypothetical protein
MNLPAKPRVVIAVQPPLLGSMMADILRKVGADEVVDRDLRTLSGTDYDIALISGIPGADLSVGVIIQFPDQEGRAGLGGISKQNTTEPVVIDGPGAILGLLDHYFPTSIRRSEHV